MANWCGKVCSNGPEVKDTEALAAVLEKWRFKPDGDGEAVTAEIDGGGLDIYGDSGFDPVPAATMEFFETLSAEEKSSVEGYVSSDIADDLIEALKLYLDSEYESDCGAFLRDVQPHLAETLIVQEIGSMKCCFSFSAREWEVPAGEGPIVFHQLSRPPEVWLNGERDYDAEVEHLREMILQYEVTDIAVCDGCGKEWLASDLFPPKQITQRLDPGTGVVPSGECPDCECLTYPKMKIRTPAKDG